MASIPTAVLSACAKVKTLKEERSERARTSDLNMVVRERKSSVLRRGDERAFIRKRRGPRCVHARSAIYSNIIKIIKQEDVR